MIRILVLIGLLAPPAALAQTSGPDQSSHRQHMQMMMTGKDEAPAQKQSSGPTEVGEGAFAAIQEIVTLLNADPKTDWSKVDIDALRQHLVDMNNVTLKANVTSAPIDAGVRFEVTGEGPVRESIRRMVLTHAATMNGVDGWMFEAKAIEGGASLDVHAPPRDVDKVKGLGFFGIMTLGMHHQTHHLMIARGMKPSP